MSITLHQCLVNHACFPAPMPLWKSALVQAIDGIKFPPKKSGKTRTRLESAVFFCFLVGLGACCGLDSVSGIPLWKGLENLFGKGPKPLGRTTSPIQALVYFSMGFSQVPHVRMTRPWITTPAMDAVGATFLACLQSEAVINWPGPVGTLGISTGKRTAVCWLPDFLAEFMEHEPWKQMKNHWKADMAMEHQPFLVGNRSTVDGSEILHQLRLAVFAGFLYIPGGAGFLPSTEL